MRIGVGRFSSVFPHTQRVFHSTKHPIIFSRHSQCFLSRCSASNALQLHQRHYYSTTPDDQKPLPEGLQEVLATATKVRVRKDHFHEYKQRDVFAPSGMSWLANWMMFYHLNRPQKTQLDLVEFIRGAKYAMEAVMIAMYSKEFADYVEREAAAPGALKPDNEAAEMVQRSLKTESYEAFKAFILQSANDGIRVEVEKVEVHSAHVLSIRYERVAKGPTTNSLGATVVGLPVDERLKLAVLYEMTEHVSVDSDGDEDVVIRENKAIWQFESNVTTPGEVDWIIKPLHLVA